MLAFALDGFCQEIKERGQNLKSRIRRVMAEVGGTDEVEQGRVQNPESTDVEWRQESTTRIRIQNVKSPRVGTLRGNEETSKSRI